MTAPARITDTRHPDAPLERWLHEGRPFPRRKVRPLKALRHLRRLFRDKENTEEVFHIFRALNGGAYERSFQRFMSDPEGRKRVAEARVLPPLLDDHARWERLPEGSFGRAYIDFMQREGLTAAGLVAESLKAAGTMETRARTDPLRLWWGDRSRDTHDMYHVLTGYGRDALGEACVLAFTYPQHMGRGLKFIATLGALEARKGMPRGCRVLRAVREGERIGREAVLVDAQDLLGRFHLPLEDVRRELRIARPQEYHRIHRQCRAAGVDPYDLVGADRAATDG